MTDESVQGRPDDADFFATTALALGQALAEIATLVGLNPDDGELYPITDRVRRLAEAQQQRAALWDLCKKITRFAMIERCKSCHDDGKELAALRASAVVLPENAYGKIDRALTANPYLSDLEVLAALGVITKLIDSWRPVTMEAAPADAVGVSGAEPGNVAGAKDVLTPAMQRHLVELLYAPYWHPETPGEWSTARALKRRGYLRANASRGQPPYSLTDKGSEAARALNTAAGVSGAGVEEAVRRLTAPGEHDLGDVAAEFDVDLTNETGSSTGASDGE